MSACEDALVASAALVIFLCKQKKRHQRRLWMRPSLRERDIPGQQSLIQRIARDDATVLRVPPQVQDKDIFHNFLRTSIHTLLLLLY